MRKLLLLLVILAIVSCIPQNSADYEFAIGLEHFENEEYLHALQKFDEAIQLDENYAMAYLKRAQVHLIKDDYELAFDDLNHFISFDTLISEGYTQRALLKLVVSDYYGALSDCNRAVEADEMNADAYRIRGRAKYQFGNNEGAVADFSKAIELNQNDGISYFLRGDANMSLANSGAGCDDYNMAADLGSLVAYKRIAEYCSNVDQKIEVITVEKTVVKEKIVTKEVEPAKEEPAVVTEALDKWHRLVDLKSILYQVNSLTIDRNIQKGVPIEWGKMGSLGKSYVMIKLKENGVYNLQFIVDGEKTHEGFYKFTGTAEVEENSVYIRIDGDQDEEIISNQPLEFVLSHYQTNGRTTIELMNYTRGVGAKLLF